MWKRWIEKMEREGGRMERVDKKGVRDHHN